jgi:hypothetical protein
METRPNTGGVKPSAPPGPIGQITPSKPGKKSGSGGFLKTVKDSAIGKLAEKVIEHVWPKIEPYFGKIQTFLGGIVTFVLSYAAKLSSFELTLIALLFFFICACLILLFMLKLLLDKLDDKSPNEPGSGDVNG